MTFHRIMSYLKVKIKDKRNRLINISEYFWTHFIKVHEINCTLFLKVKLLEKKQQVFLALIDSCKFNFVYVKISTC